MWKYLWERNREERESRRDFDGFTERLSEEEESLVRVLGKCRAIREKEDEQMTKVKSKTWVCNFVCSYQIGRAHV